MNIYLLVDEAVELGVISDNERTALKEAQKAKEAVVQVDGFKIDDYLARKV